MVAIQSFCFVSCSKDDDSDSNEKTENLSNHDPEGTIVLNMVSGSSDNYYKIDDLGEIHIDAANNFRGYSKGDYKIEFVTVGKVEGLGKVNMIPRSGWGESAAVVPETGYLMRSRDKYGSGSPRYARIYVVDYLTSTATDEYGNTTGSNSGATIKYQAPLQQTISLSSNSLTFPNKGGRKSLGLKTPTHLEVKERPDWCYVEIFMDSVVVRVNTNKENARSGKIILSNIMGDATISVTQGAMDPINLKKNSLTFTNEASSQAIELMTPTYFEVDSIPKWCQAFIYMDSLVVFVQKNTSVKRSGEILLKNAMSKATISIVQESLPAISLEKTSLTFPSGSTSQTVKLKRTTIVELVEKPEWSDVTLTSDSIVVSVVENLSASQRTGKVVLKNIIGTTTLQITQKASSSPLFEKGQGTKSDPYQIKTSQQFENIAKAFSSHFILVNDIDLRSYLYEYGNGWEPIANFEGTLDGKNHVIKGLWIKRPNTNTIGLFSSMAGAKVSNLKIEIDEKEIIGGAYVGALCGKASSCVITDCIVTGNITGNGICTGGICGEGSNTDIIQCFVNSDIKGNKDYVGGLSGRSIGITSRCSFKGNIQGPCYVAGICGAFEGNHSSISECRIEGTIEGNNYVTSIVGKVIMGSCFISNCYSIASLAGTAGNYCDGISRGGTHERCYFAGRVSPDVYFSCGGTYTYFDSTVSGQNGDNGRSTIDMKKQSTYESWDFNNIWKITEGQTYPTLRCFDK